MRAIAFKDSTTAARRTGSRTLRALFMVLAFGFNLLLIPGVGLYLMNDEDYRHVLIWSADNLLDSQLEIDGVFSVSFGREVELSAETVRLRANNGSYDLSIGKLNLVQRFASYLSTGTLWINSLSMEDLRAEIKEIGSKQGSGGQPFSLPFVVIEQIQLRNLSLAYTEIDQQRHTIDLSHVSLDDTDNQGPIKVSAAGVMNTRTLQLDGSLGSLEQLRSMNQAYPIELTLLSGTVDGSSAIRPGKPVIKLNGTVGSTPSGSMLVEAAFDVDVPELVPIFSKEIVADKLGHLQGSVSIAEVGGRWRIRKTQFTATGTDAYQLRVDGSVENSGQFDLNSEFGVTDPAAFGARFGIDFSGYAPVKGKGLISGNKDKLNYQGKLSVGRIDSETTLTASLVGDKPQMQGKLSIAELYLADIGISQRLSVPAQAVVAANPDSNQQPEPEAPTSVADTSVKANPDTGGQPKSETQASTSDDSQTIFDREPIDFTGLQQFNLDLEILVDQIIGEDFSIDKLAGKVKLNDGALRITPMQMTFAGGHADLELVADTRKVPSISLKVTADDLQLGGVVQHQQEEMQVAGNARLHVDINSKGRSIDELVANLSGELNMGLVKVRLPRRYVEYLSGDEPRASSASESYTMLEIDGTIAAKFGADFDLTAEALHLRANDGSYDLSFGKMNLQQNIDLYLQKGELWIDNLSMSDVEIEIIEAVNEPGDLDSGGTALEVVSAEQEPSKNELPDHDWHEFDWQVSDWPFVLVEKMQLDNITVVYTKGDETDNYILSSLVLDNDKSDEPMTLSVAGIVNELALKIEGTVGTPAEPRGKDQVFPVEYSLSSGAVGGVPNKPVFWFKGSIDRTQPGGNRIEGKFDVAVSELLSIFEQETPRSRLVSAVKQERTGEELGHLQGSLNFIEVDGRWGIKELHVVSSETDLYELRLDGDVDLSDKLEVSTHIDIPDPPLFGEAFGIDLTGYAAYKGVGVLTGDRTKLDYKGQTTIGRTENELTLAISLVGGKPTVKGKFTSPDLYLPDIGINTFFTVEAGDDIDLETGKRKDPEDQTPQDDSADEANLGTDEGANSEETVPLSADDLIVFGREPFDFSWLQGFNLDMEILIDDITGVDFSMDQLAGQIKLTDGVLRVSPMRLTLEGGTTDLNFLLEIHDTPSFTLTVLADDLILGTTIAKVQDMVPVEGKAHLNVDIKSSGNSPHEMAANLSGETSFSLEEAKIPKVYVEFLSVDVLGWMARMVTFEDSYTTLHCVMTSFDVNQGVAKSRLFFAEGAQLSIGGDATLDLGQETMDMTLLPKQKKRVAASTSTIRISGPLADPDFETSTSKGAATVAVGGAVLAPQIVIPIFLVEQLWRRVFSSEKDTGCADYIEQHEAQQQETQQQQAE